MCSNFHEIRVLIINARPDEIGGRDPLRLEAGERDAHQGQRTPHQGSTPETTQGQIDGFLSQLPFKCYLSEVASVGE